LRVLIISSGNSGQVSPFVYEQVEAVKKSGVEFDYYNVKGRGITGYLSNLRTLRKKIKSFKPDILHAHYGLSGLLSLLGKGKHPLVTTFHGNDINTLHPSDKLKPNWNKILSRIVYSGSNYSIFVTEDMAKQINAKPVKSGIIPCQVNLDIFYPRDKSDARKELKLSLSKRYVLFSSSFKTAIKNYPLAKQACSQFDNLELIELTGFSRGEVNLLLDACDVALLTSYNEGSNQFIKEAMSCCCPIVSTKVGDTEWIFGNTEGCYVTGFDPENVIGNLEKALDFGQTKGKTSGRERIIELGLDSETIARKILAVYNKVLNPKS
jgi:teichuronic acid biosynthesis glycosyltransferase TuaC